MKIEEQLQILSDLDNKTINVIKSKQLDYANSNIDVLSNFKRLSLAAKALNIDVHTDIGYSLFMVLLKIDRINNLISNNKNPVNEPLIDSFEDGINYFKLSYLNYIESTK